MSIPVQLQPNEEVIQTYRRHPIYVVLKIIGDIIVLIILVWLLNWLAETLQFLSSLIGILIPLVIIAGLLYAAFEIYRYWFDIWIVTNQRLIDSTRRHPFSHVVSSASLLNVQDINISVQGVLPTLFKFGDVMVQTASSTQQFVLRGVSRPPEVLDVIDDARDAARREMGSSNVSSVSG